MKVYIPEIGGTRYVCTLQLFPKTIPFPVTTTEYYLKQAATDIIMLLQNPPTLLPYLQYGDATKNALLAIATILVRAQQINPLPQHTLKQTGLEHSKPSTPSVLLKRLPRV